MRIRTIKPEFWSSTKVARVPREVRLVFVGLWNEADDEGRLLGSPKRLAGSLFPNDDDVDVAMMTGWLAALEAADLIVRYEVAGVAYLVVTGFLDHQKVDKRFPSRLPSPPAESRRLIGEPHRQGGEARPTVDESHRETGSGNDLLPEIGNDLLSEEGNEAVAAEPPPPPSSPAPVDRGRRNPDAPAPRLGVVVASTPRERLNGAGVGFMENPADFPESPAELVERHREDLVKSFPMLDGKPPRPTILDAVAGKWPSYIASRARLGGGHENAYAALKTWIGELAQKHRVSWEREHATVVDGSAAIERTRSTLLVVAEGPHPSEAIDAPTPEEVRALLSSATARTIPKRGRVLPAERGARAGPSGGDDSGETSASTTTT